MNATKLTLLWSCLLSAMTCAATKYQIKVLNTPSITIDNRQAKVGDWFDDTSVISWTKENQAMRVLSDENKVYTLSAKLYKEAKAKKFSEFIAYIKPLAVRGTNDDSLIAQLHERFDQDFIMLDEFVIDLSDIEDFKDSIFRFVQKNDDEDSKISFEKYSVDKTIKILRTDITMRGDKECSLSFIVRYSTGNGESSLLTDSFNIEVLPGSR